MDYEKKYEKLVDAVKVLRDNNPSDEGIQNWVNDNVPELKESEVDDEKIREALISVLKSDFEKDTTIYDISVGDIIVWLEKQGEKKATDKVESMEHSYITTNSDFFQWIYDRLKYVYNENPNVDYMLSLKERIEDMKKPTDKVEPKFKIGDWIVQQGVGLFKIIEVCKFGYEVIDCMNKRYSIPFLLENECHLWAIQDSKPGDVLAFDNGTIVIFKDLYNSTTFHSYCHIEDGIFDVNKEELPDWWKGEGFKPATKEQNDILFTKMKEAGYMWDSEKKELKKIHVIDEGKAEMDYCFTKMMNGEKVNPWSEEDEKQLNDIIELLPGLSNRHNWLKSIKERINHQWKPSEEQLNALDIAKDRNDKTGWYLCNLYEQLKKL